MNIKEHIEKLYNKKYDYQTDYYTGDVLILNGKYFNDHTIDLNGWPLGLAIIIIKDEKEFENFCIGRNSNKYMALIDADYWYCDGKSFYEIFNSTVTKYNLY